MANSGDLVKITTADKEYQGRLMPTQSENTQFLKLENGYNIGISKEKIQSIEVITAYSEKRTESDLPTKKGLKKIVVLHTGGTIASKVDYTTGGVVTGFSPSDLISMVPELLEIANIETDVAIDTMSEEITIDNYQQIAKSIKKHAPNCEGIIIGHGTDTMGYSAAALSFMFESLPIPVLLVGSQRSTDRGSSDAAMNLICAARFIATTDFCGVGICMHHNSSDDICAIIPGTRARKMHTSRRDAFKAINDSPIALVDYKKESVDYLKTDYPKKAELILKDAFKEVGFMKVHPVMSSKLFETYVKNYDALVIEGTGLGHAPTNIGENNIKNFEILKSFIGKGGIVAITSQCIYGRVNAHVYTNARKLSEIGCIYCEDMISETAYIKLCWLLGNYSAEEAKKLLPKNLRGEISEKSHY